MKDEAGRSRAFTNLEMNEEAVKTIESNGFVIVQRYNIMTTGILSQNLLTNRQGQMDRCKYRETTGETEIKF